MAGQWDIGKLLAASGGYWTSAAIHAAVGLDIFTLLDGKALTAAEVSEAIPADVRGTTHLLRALAALELIGKESELFSSTPFSSEFLSRNSDKYMGYIISHHRTLFPSFAQLEQAVKSGRPTRARISHSNSEETENFIMGMFNQGMQQAPKVARHIDLSDKEHLLDLGGGPGTYAVHFCLENPDLRATIWDLPSTREIALKTVERFGLAGRISFTAGDFSKDRITGHHDVVFLSHILHGEGPAQAQHILENAVSSLVPGGQVIIHEFILNNTEDGPVFPALFSLNMLVGTPRGQSYSEKELGEMLDNAGLEDIKRIPLDSPNGAGIMCGTLSRSK